MPLQGQYQKVLILLMGCKLSAARKTRWCHNAGRSCRLKLAAWRFNVCPRPPHWAKMAAFFRFTTY
jgi:hypothetical protein